MNGSKKPNRTPGVIVKRAVPGILQELFLFPHHTRTRMKERGVSEEEVFLPLEKPDEKGLPTKGRRFHWRKGRLHVVFERWLEKLTIITTYRK